MLRKMKPQKSILIGSLVLCMGILCEAPSTGAQSFSRLYTISIRELEPLVLEWLTGKGFEIQRVGLNLGDVRINMTRSAEKWQIVLKPRSEGITEIQTDFAPSAAQRCNALDLLATYIAGYIRGAAGKKELPNRFFPPPILSQVSAVVCLSTKSNKKTSHHTGFVVDPQGLILTTIHDVETFHEITVTLNDGREFTGDVIKKNIDQDLALINIEAGLATAVSLAQGRNLLYMGEKVYSIGCPIHRIDAVVPGIINGPPRRVDQLIYWQVDMQIHPGASGSPVFDVQGNLAGIVKGRYRGTQSIGFLIPVETIVAFVKEP